MSDDKAFETWRETQPWYAISKPDPEDHEDDGAMHRLMNIAAHEAWTASRAAALEEAEKAVERELLEEPTTNGEDTAYNTAIEHATTAIRSLSSQAGKEKGDK